MKTFIFSMIMFGFVIANAGQCPYLEGRYKSCHIGIVQWTDGNIDNYMFIKNTARVVYSTKNVAFFTKKYIQDVGYEITEHTSTCANDVLIVNQRRFLESVPSSVTKSQVRYSRTSGNSLLIEEFVVAGGMTTPLNETICY